MICSPLCTQECGISIFTSAAIVVRMNFDASPIVHVNAPSTAWPIPPNTPPRDPERAQHRDAGHDQRHVGPAAYAGAGASSSTPSRPAPGACAASRHDQRSRSAPGSGQDGRDHDEDQHDPADHPEQMIGRALRAEDHQPRDSTSTRPTPVAISHSQLLCSVLIRP